MPDPKHPHHGHMADDTEAPVVQPMDEPENLPLPGDSGDNGPPPPPPVKK